MQIPEHNSVASRINPSAAFAVGKSGRAIRRSSSCKVREGKEGREGTVQLFRPVAMVLRERDFLRSYKVAESPAAPLCLPCDRTA
jgi:hypothetical protein